MIDLEAWNIYIDRRKPNVTNMQTCKIQTRPTPPTCLLPVGLTCKRSIPTRIASSHLKLFHQYFFILIFISKQSSNVSQTLYRLTRITLPSAIPLEIKIAVIFELKKTKRGRTISH